MGIQMINRSVIRKKGEARCILVCILNSSGGVQMVLKVLYWFYKFSPIVKLNFIASLYNSMI